MTCVHTAPTRFLLKPQRLTRVSPLPAGRALTWFQDIAPASHRSALAFSRAARDCLQSCATLRRPRRSASCLRILRTSNANPPPSPPSGK